MTQAAGVKLHIDRLHPMAVAAVSTSAILAALIAVLLPSSGFALVFVATLLLATVPSLSQKNVASRFVVFFSLLAVGDFVKRATFLLPNQSAWSQYSVMLLTSVYYFLFILLPWAISRRRHLTSIERLAFAFIALALGNTWISPQFTLESKLAATVLLIMPWSVLPVVASYPEVAPRVARALVVWGGISAVYGIWQFFFGPTQIELNWAQSAKDISIGAWQLETFVQGDTDALAVWRIIGLQPDGFTFGILQLTALSSAWMLRAQGKMRQMSFTLISLLLATGILMSLVRGVWVALLALLLYVWFAQRFSSLLRPRVLLLLFAGSFLAAGIASSFLYGFAWLAGTTTDPLVSRALTFGTLEARNGVFDAFVSALQARWLIGLGYAASPWLTGKFGGGADLPANFGSHNAVVELLLYVGVPGLLLFTMLLYRVFAQAAETYASAQPAFRAALIVVAAYLFAMFVTGLSNGGVFLSYYFFLFAGILASNSAKQSEEITTQ
ncbi:MAG: hypothetical protein M1343_00745 [Chloroflexi bacterium]|nr:hypothetical protein [Chloroflexota bacterium]